MSHSNGKVPFQNFSTDKSTAAGLIPGVPIEAVSCTRQNELIFTKFTHGEFEWTVTRTLDEFKKLNKSLHSQMSAFIMHSARGSFNHLALDLSSNKEDHSADLIKFLNNLLEIEEARKRKDVIQFLKISRFSFVSELGKKGTEGFINVQSSDYESSCWNIWNYFCGRDRWCILKENCVLFLDSKKDDLTGVLLLEEEFNIEYDPSHDPTELTFKNANYEVTGKCKTAQEAREWKNAMDHIVANNHVSNAENKYEAFSKVRDGKVHWFVDGHNYFKSVADAMEQAKEQIFITDWIMSPSVHLKRDDGNRLYWRLDNILKRKADQGIHIRIILYKEIEGTVANYSREVQEYLNNLHPNITVLRHPEFALDSLLWSHHEKLVIVDQTVAFVGGIDLAYNRYDDHKHALSDYDRDSEGLTRWVGKDYNNLYAKDRLNLTDETKEYDDKYRHDHARTPWHDVASVVYGPAVRDVAQHFIQRWNFTKMHENGQDNKIPFLMPKSQNEKTFDMPYLSILPEAVEAKVQILRSSCDWSAGHDRIETSIHEAYIDIINKAEKYIYIENQFFISKRGDTSGEWCNQIVDALFKRILRAFTSNEKFRVYVVIPLLPSAENDIRYDSESQSIQVILGFQYRSINRKDGSLLSDLKHHLGDKLPDYVSFCSLRSHGVINDKAVTEILYVHSKLMVVDDKFSIIGSANINERSLNGDRDSEVAILVEDTNFVDSLMDESKFQVGAFSSRLRKRCFAEHLGLLPDDYNEECDFEPIVNIADIVCDEFFHNIWCETAKTNTDVFEKVFRPVPSNKIKMFDKTLIEKFQSERLTDQDEIKDELKKVKGHLIKHPLEALENESLTPDTGTKESLVPSITFK